MLYQVLSQIHVGNFRDESYKNHNLLFGRNISLDESAANHHKPSQTRTCRFSILAFPALTPGVAPAALSLESDLITARDPSHPQTCVSRLGCVCTCFSGLCV